MNTKAIISLMARIRAKVPVIKYMDIYNAQYTDQNAKREDPFNAPAVFIEMLSGDWQSMHPTIQAQDSGFVLHIVENTYKRTRNMDLKSPTQQTINMEHLRTAQKVHEAVQLFVPDGCQGAMERTNTEYDHDYDQLLITRHTYSCVILEEKDTEKYTEKVVVSVALQDIVEP